MESRSKREVSGEDTRRRIMTAAAELFASRSYAAVTMREIAAAAGRSHTAIYNYFADKEALLQELSLPPLRQLEAQLGQIRSRPDLPPVDRLKAISRQILVFSLENRGMYEVYLEVGAGRVDEQEPALELNRLRNRLFVLLRQSLADALPAAGEDQLLAFSRIFYYLLRGVIGTYRHSSEAVPALLERLGPTFDQATDVLLHGFRQQPGKGVQADET
jgi:AcrR family transcriptional regulator